MRIFICNGEMLDATPSLHTKLRLGAPEAFSSALPLAGAPVTATQSSVSLARSHQSSLEHLRYDEVSHVAAAECDPVCSIAFLVRDVIRCLPQQQQPKFRRDFGNYLTFIERAEAVRQRVVPSMFELFPQVTALQDDLRSLHNHHNSRYFLDLIDSARASRIPEVVLLQKHLGIEDMSIAPWTEIWAFTDIHVDRIEGAGNHCFVKEVLSTGYRLKETGEVLRKPRVVVRQSTESPVFV